MRARISPSVASRSPTAVATACTVAVSSPGTSRSVTRSTPSPGAPGEGVLRVTLRLVPGLDTATVQAVATAVGERLATDGEIRARIDGLAFSIS